jgi:hypothetical protein
LVLILSQLPRGIKKGALDHLDAMRSGTAPLSNKIFHLLQVKGGVIVLIARRPTNRILLSILGGHEGRKTICPRLWGGHGTLCPGSTRHRDSAALPSRLVRKIKTLGALRAKAFGL